MRAVAFVGPSISASEGRALLPMAEFRGPAACGDVYRAAREGFEFIGICDGYFEHRPSVWHKEILWALSEGVRVYGAASMGALRAAELHVFGMVGVGRIFEQFRDGILDDDDEVAVTHQSEELGFRCVSEAMVNIRASLQSAMECGAISATLAKQLVAAGKGLFYADRNLEALLVAATAAGLEASGVAAVRAWFAEHGIVNQKHRDAVAMVGRMADEMLVPAAVQPCVFDFEYTDAWHAFKRSMDSRGSAESARVKTTSAGVGALASSQQGSTGEGSTGEGSTGEGSTGEGSLTAQSFERALALQLAEADGVRPTADEVQQHSELLRREFGLNSPEVTAAWLRDRGLDLRGFSLLVYGDWLYRKYRARARALAATQTMSARLLGNSPQNRREPE